MKNWILLGIGVVIGAIAGWSYWYFIGCEEGCTITSNSLNSTLYGMLMGGLVMNLFRKEERNTTENKS